MIEPAKLVLLFGSTSAVDDPCDPAQRLKVFVGELLASGDDLDDSSSEPLEIKAMVTEAVAQQIIDEDPPNAWNAARRLLGLGHTRDQVLGQLRMAMLSHLATEADGHGTSGQTTNWEGLAKHFDALPLPSEQQLHDVFVQLLKDQQPIDCEELEAKAIERLGANQDDHAIAAIVERVFDDMEEDEFLAYLPGDLVVAPSIWFAGKVLTHRLNDAEVQLQFLRAAFDLAPFSALDSLSLKGEDNSVECVSGEPGHLAWHGPDGWLGQFEEGDLLSIVVDNATLHLEKVIDESRLVNELDNAFVKRCFETASEGSALPVSAEDLMLVMMRENAQFFDTPHLPLSELCEKAGFEVKMDSVASNPKQWETKFRLLAQLALSERLGSNKRQDAGRLVDSVYEPVDNQTLRQLGSCLRDFETADAVASVLTSIIHAESGDVDIRVKDLVNRLCAVAVNPEAHAAALLLRSLIHETERDLHSAEDTLRQAIAIAPTWPPTVDRLAWYLSDRGKGPEALRPSVPTLTWTRFRNQLTY